MTRNESVISFGSLESFVSGVDFLTLGKRRVLSLLAAQLETFWFGNVYDKRVRASTTRTPAE